MLRATFILVAVAVAVEFVAADRAVTAEAPRCGYASDQQ